MSAQNAVLKGQTKKMAKAIITMKVMPENPDVDMERLEAESKKVIEDYGGEVGKVEKEPIAFGLVALKLIFVIDESKGTEELESKLTDLEFVQSASVIDYRRALG